jgi:hypothetical protein
MTIIFHTIAVTDATVIMVEKMQVMMRKGGSKHNTLSEEL